MLLLTRRLGETIHIGDDIMVTIVGIRGGQIRLGITAPKHVAVHREEVYERIKNEQYDHLHSPRSSAAPGLGTGVK